MHIICFAGSFDLCRAMQAGELSHWRKQTEADDAMHLRCLAPRPGLPNRFTGWGKSSRFPRLGSCALSSPIVRPVQALLKQGLRIKVARRHAPGVQRAWCDEHGMQLAWCAAYHEQPSQAAQCTMSSRCAARRGRPGRCLLCRQRCRGLANASSSASTLGSRPIRIGRQKWCSTTSGSSPPPLLASAPAPLVAGPSASGGRRGVSPPGFNIVWPARKARCCDASTMQRRRVDDAACFDQAWGYLGIRSRNSYPAWENRRW